MAHRNFQIVGHAKWKNSVDFSKVKSVGCLVRGRQFLRGKHTAPRQALSLLLNKHKVHLWTKRSSREKFFLLGGYLSTAWGNRSLIWGVWPSFRGNEARTINKNLSARSRTNLLNVFFVLQIINKKNQWSTCKRVQQSYPYYDNYGQSGGFDHVPFHDLTPSADVTCSKANPWKRKIVLGNMIRASHGYIDYVKTFGVFNSISQIKENFHSRIR